MCKRPAPIGLTENLRANADGGTEGLRTAVSAHSGRVRPPSITIPTHPRSVPPALRCGPDPQLQRGYNSMKSRACTASTSNSTTTSPCTRPSLSCRGIVAWHG